MFVYLGLIDCPSELTHSMLCRATPVAVLAPLAPTPPSPVQCILGLLDEASEKK